MFISCGLLYLYGQITMEINKIYNEPCLDTLKKMPNEFLDCVITSPPYWQLRDYGYDGQWGLEPNFQKYLEHLWEMMGEIHRVLKSTGTVWINLGDTYEKSTKCLLLIPHRFAIGCIDRGWIMRNDVIWAKRNGMPESCTDRFSKKHEYFFFMVKSQKYFFDLDSIRDKHSQVSIDRDKYGRKAEYGDGRASVSRSYDAGTMCNPNGKNPGSVSDFWDVLTKPSKNQHYASYNEELIRKPILAGCPEGGIIYDPFMGTGSTAESALRSKRQFVGSEMSIRYMKIAETRLEPLLRQTKLF